MRRTRFRRSPRVAWLPVYGDHAYATDQAEDSAIGIRFELNLSANPGIINDAVAITWDGGDSPSAAQAAGTATHSLADFVDGQSYRLRRIVGKFWCGASATEASNVTAIQVAAGFIVGRATDAGALILGGLHDPLHQDSADDPWIWRRSWLLGPRTVTSDWPFNGLPRGNWDYGSVADGPHIDQKTARVISSQERLIFVVAAQIKQTTTDVAPTGSNLIHGILDYRLLATMRKTQGNRGNSSR